MRLSQNLISLNRGVTKYGKAPHKPILLLAVVDGFEKGYLKGKEVPISEDLLASFHDYWRLLVDTGHDANFSLPFFHLGSEKSGIWQLRPYWGKEIPVTKSNSIKSFKALKQTVAYAVLSDELVLALQNPVQRNEIKQTLIQHYFPAKTGIIQANTVLYSESVKKDILYDPTENYVRKVIRYFEEIKTEEREEELILRSHIFKKAVIEVYDGCCAISGQKLKIDANPVLLDACHIIPFAESHDDTITNGLALSPTLHRAFDRGLVTVSDNYRIQVHPRLSDYYPEVGLRQFNNQELKLPADARFHPSPEKLYRHRQRFAFQV